MVLVGNCQALPETAAFYRTFQLIRALDICIYAWQRRRVNRGWQHWSRTSRLHFPMETAWLIRLACCLLQHSCSERLDRQKLPAVTQMQYHWLIETSERLRSRAHASRSHPVVHNVSKVHHPLIRLINETAVEKRAWLKCKYSKCKWFIWIMGNYKVVSWDLLDLVLHQNIKTRKCILCFKRSFVEQITLL